jgi:hypothetical protein
MWTMSDGRPIKIWMCGCLQVGSSWPKAEHRFTVIGTEPGFGSGVCPFRLRCEEVCQSAGTVPDLTFNRCASANTSSRQIGWVPVSGERILPGI